MFEQNSISALEAYTANHPTECKPESVIAEYTVTIATSKIDKADTRAGVFFEIGGLQTELDKPDYPDFKKGAVDTYFLEISKMTLQDLRDSEIRLFHDNTNSQPGWHVRSVDLKVRFEGQRVFRTYKRWEGIGWLALTSSPYSVEVVLQDADEVRKIVAEARNKFRAKAKKLAAKT